MKSVVAERVFGSSVILLPEVLNSQSTSALWRELEGFSPLAQTYRIDASALQRCTGTGIALLRAIEEKIVAAGGRCEWQGVDKAIDQQLRTYQQQIEVSRSDSAKLPSKTTQTPIVTIGRKIHEACLEAARAVSYIGEVALSLGRIVRRPKLVRWTAFWNICEMAGVNALPVVMLLGFLLGLILAFQSAIPMKMFGAQIYVASLLGIALVRELGPLITAILLTGRSGSAFAAEIGTMQVNEELDALRTMGLDPLLLLAIPRILAGIVVMPILTLFANIAGLFGGLIVMWSMGFSFSLYCNQLRTYVASNDLVGGLVKAMVFGLLVSAVGCLRGLDTGRDAAAVGKSTTSSVVSGIILIAVSDGLFAVLFYAMGW